MDKQEGIMGDILKYLKQQGTGYTGEEEEDTYDPEYGLKRVKSILSDILEAINKRAQLKEAFEAKVRAHNQYPLFDFGEVIPNFYIDDEFYDDMTFRETLVISTYPHCLTAAVPTPVGGLCLDVQKALGKGPLVRRDPKFDQELIDAITFKTEEGNIEDVGNWSRACDTCEEQTEGRDTKKSTEKRKKCPKSEPSVEESETESPKVEVSPTQERLLQFELGIQDSLKRTQCKFLVHLSSQFDVNGMNAGSLLTAWVDKNFHTLEEKRTEFLVDKDNIIQEKSLFVSMQKGRYYVKYRSTTDDYIEKNFYSFKKTKNYIGEGANYVLMRYLALARYLGDFELSTMYINGTMCRNIYRCTGPESGIVNNKTIDVCKIYRTIIEECGIVHNSVTVLTLNGQIIKQEWEKCNYILQLNPFAEIKNEKPGKLEHLHLKHVWENDMQLFSKYLDRKMTEKVKVQKYLEDHTELRSILSDFLQKVLLLKPTNLLDFTIEHFSQFAPVYFPKESSIFEEEEEESVRYEGEKDEYEEVDESVLAEEEKIRALQYLMTPSDYAICEDEREEEEEEEEEVESESTTSCICEGVCVCVPIEECKFGEEEELNIDEETKEVECKDEEEEKEMEEGETEEKLEENKET